MDAMPDGLPNVRCSIGRLVGNKAREAGKVGKWARKSGWQRGKAILRNRLKMMIWRIGTIRSSDRMSNRMSNRISHRTNRYESRKTTPV